jgi:hypothetical protein
MNVHTTNSYTRLDILLAVSETRLRTGRSVADLAHILRRKSQRATSADALVSLGMAVKRINLYGIAREPGAAGIFMS